MGVGMKRREFVTLLGAQQPEMPVTGDLGSEEL
jgi:hypothetical protein